MDLSNELSCGAGTFSCCCNPHRFLHSGFEALFPQVGTLVVMVCLTPQLFLLVHPHASVGRPGLPTEASPGLPAATLPAPVLQPPSCQDSSPPGYPSLFLLPVWMNVSSLTFWLLDFHTVLFSGNSGYFLFLNLLLSFWFCEEA